MPESAKLPVSSPPRAVGIGSPKRSWEDPHPGQRISISLGIPSGQGGYPSTISGDCYGGVAAKADSPPSQSRPSMARRNIYVKHRNTIPKPLMIPAKVLEEPESKSAPLVSERPCSVGPPGPTLVELPPMETFRPLDIDTDTDTEAGTYYEDMDVDSEGATPNTSAQVPFYFSDYSNYLGISLRDDDDNASVTVVGSDTYSRTNSVDDLYGWEAELDRKVKGGCTTSDKLCEIDAYHHPYRTTGNEKRSLLHRVFTSSRRPNAGLPLDQKTIEFQISPQQTHIRSSN